MNLGPAVVIGHSYGAVTALFLAAKHPELTSALVLAEPPAISLLAHILGEQAATGKMMLEDIQRRMVAPMRREFGEGDRERGVATFIDYVFNDPRAWDKMSESSRQQTMRDAHEWDIIMTTSSLFPEIRPRTIRKIQTPTLLLSGAESHSFLGLIMNELAHLLPDNQSIVFPDAGHQMWYQKPEDCRRAVEAFLERHGIH